MPDVLVGERAMGRNTTRSALGDEGLVFVKEFAGDADDAARRYGNSLAWEEVASDAGLTLSPRLLDRDEGARRLTFEFVADAPTLQELISTLALPAVDDERFTELTTYFGRAGRMLGEVHSCTTGETDVAITHPRLPGDQDYPLAVFEQLTPPQFVAASAAELECWRLFHHDEELQLALRRWANDPRTDESRVPVHGDLRLDQFLAAPEGLTIVDWEEFGVGSPSRDVAGVVGSIVLEALMRTFRHVETETANAADLHRDLMGRGAAVLEAVAPLIRVFLDSYKAASSLTLDRERLGRDIGWLLIERVVARAMLSARLPAADRAVAGVGRQALLHPDGLRDVLGVSS